MKNLNNSQSVSDFAKEDFLVSLLIPSTMLLPESWSKTSGSFVIAMRNLLQDNVSLTDVEVAANKFAPHFIAVSSYLKCLFTRHFSPMSAQRQHLAALKKEHARIFEAAPTRHYSSIGSAKTSPPFIVPGLNLAPSAAASEPPSSYAVKKLPTHNKNVAGKNSAAASKSPVLEQ